MISRDEILMGRDKSYPLTPELETNLAVLLIRVNQFRTAYGIPMTVSSGYRPGHFNTDAHGAANSPHKTCQAVDFHDSDGAIKQFVLSDPSILVGCDLYMEDPAHTGGLQDGWIHIQTRPIPSGRRIFNP